MYKRQDSNLGSFTPVKHVPLDQCKLQRHVGVNNLPNVVTRQRGGRESNEQPMTCKSNALTTRLLHHPSVVVIKSTTNLDLSPPSDISPKVTPKKKICQPNKTQVNEKVCKNSSIDAHVPQKISD